jgi:hypothetical protein
MRTKRRNLKKRRNSKTKKGGFFSFLTGNKAQPSLDSSTCNPNNLNNLEEPMDLYNEYQKCCPKTYGLKNSSSYCNSLEQKYKESKSRDMIETPQPDFQGYAPKKSSWSPFVRGGKTKKRGMRKNRKH